MTNRSNSFLLVLLVLIGVGGGSLFYTGYKRQKQFEKELFELREQSLGLNTHIDAMQEPQVVERVVTNAQVWRPIQERAQDTVIQVFSQIAEVDILQPYKSPNQYAAFGSGFFINEQGDLITNAHVVDQAKSVWIQIPSLGKRIIDVDIVSVSPERDIALLRVKPEGLLVIRSLLGAVPFLPLGDSDLVKRSDEVLALGYPLGQQSLKSTTGVISGREQHLIQMSAALNPGNSGGPLLNNKGEVIGINSANIPTAQNIGYIVPINDFKNIQQDLYNEKLLRKPFLGVLFNNATDCLTEYLGNPAPGGCYVVEVVPGSTLDNAGIKNGDMIYELNGHKLDIFGEMTVPWSEDKISIVDYVTRLSVGQDVNLVVYRTGKRMEVTAKFSQSSLPSVRRIFPGFESIDYEVFGGMVVMDLTINHIQTLIGSASGLAKFAEMKNQIKQVLVITHIFPNSQLYRSRTITVGATLQEINGIHVATLDDFRKAIKKPGKFLTIKAADNVARATDNIFVTLEMSKILEEEPRLAMDYKYPLSKVTQDLIKLAQANQAVVLARAPQPENAAVVPTA